MSLCVGCSKSTTVYYKGYCATCLDKAIKSIHQPFTYKQKQNPPNSKPKYRYANRVYLWESMTAMYQTKDRVAKFTDSKALLADYLKKKLRKPNDQYADYCRKFPDKAYDMAEKVYLYRLGKIASPEHDFDYYDMES